MNKLKRWNTNLNQAWERISRGKKLALNLILCALIGVLIWIRLGCPLPTMEMEFRRMERTHLLPRSEIVFQDKGRERDLIPEDENLHLTLGQPTFLGLTGGEVTAAVYDTDRWLVDRFPLEEGPTPVPFGYAKVVWYRTGIVEFRYPMMFLQIPKETARGELSLSLNYRGADYSWSGQGYDLGEGIWMFPIKTPDTGYSDHWLQGARCTLTLYGADGALLLEWSGRLEG